MPARARGPPAAAASGASGGAAGTGGRAGSEDGGVTEPETPCDPTVGGKVSLAQGHRELRDARAACLLHTYNAPAGDEWRAASEWPLPNEQRTHYYFADGAALSKDAPPAGAAVDTAQVEYGVTPANRATKGLLYATEPLAEDLQVTGHPVVELWVASSATDGDFVVTLEDLAPDGTATSYFMEGRLRASHRALEDAPYDNLGLPWHPFTEAATQPLVPGEPVLLAFDLQPMSLVFAKGHRIRVVLTFADAATAMPQPAPMVTVHRNAEPASRITLPEIH